MADVAFDHVTKRFRSVVALNDFTLRIPDKEFLVLVGPSGSGKSTALRLLAGLDEITEGTISIGGRVVNDIAPRDRDIAMVFQTYALYPHMSIRDNIGFGLKLRKMNKGEIDRRVKEAARILGISELLGRKPGQLSGGQRQRVALARAIVREPRVFLLDEPLSNLDAKLRVNTRAEISKLHQRLGTTFVYVTHDQVEAMTMATRIAVMNFGVIQQVGTPQHLYDHPANVFVAGFIGSPSMNFFDVKVVGGDHDLRLEGESFTLPVPKSKAAGLRSFRGREIVLGIRPENIHDRDFVPPQTNAAPVAAKVEVTELMGNEVFLHLLAGEQSFLARVDPRTGARPDRPLQVVFDLEKMHAFDPESERNLTDGDQATSADPASAAETRAFDQATFSRGRPGRPGAE